MSELHESLELKHQTEEQLYSDLIDRIIWDESDKALISSAYEYVKNLHQNDLYKGCPYIFHLLRVANRIVQYLHIEDAELVTAALLHDSVEDHAAEIYPPDSEQLSPVNTQMAALEQISQQFSERVAATIAAVTNKPSKKRSTKAKKREIYIEKVAEATQTVDGWIIKFCDWCDNAVGIIHRGDDSTDQKKIKHLQKKYAGVIDIIGNRYKKQDIQNLLDYSAKRYVERQLELGYDRLLYAK